MSSDKLSFAGLIWLSVMGYFWGLYVVISHFLGLSALISHFTSFTCDDQQFLCGHPLLKGKYSIQELQKNYHSFSYF